MRYVQRDQAGNVIAFYERENPGVAEEALPDNHPDILKFLLGADKARKKIEIRNRFKRALEDGMAYGGKRLQIREEDQLNITAMGNEARWAKATGAPWPANFAWRMADDTYLSLPTADFCIELGLAAKSRVLDLRQNKWRLDDLVRAATTKAALDAIDIDSGWPA